MPSAVHEAIVELIRARPASLVSLVRDALGFEVEVIASAARIVDPTVPQLIAPARACDLALEIPLAHPEVEGSPDASWLVEVQETRDEEKEWAWSLYWASERARRKGGETMLLVITTDRSVEAWANRVLANVIPRVGRWAVLGPSSVAKITDPAEARRDPEAALVSGLIHAKRGGEDFELVPALAAAASTLPRNRAMLFQDIIGSRLNELAFAAMEALMLETDYDWQGPIGKKLREKGREEGREEGLEEGREAVRQLLAKAMERGGLVLSPARAAMVAATTDLATLQRWVNRALSAATTDEIFADP